MAASKQLIKIDKEFINYLRISYQCPACHEQVIIIPDTGGKEYFSCGVCQHPILVRGNRAHYIQDLIHQVDFARKALNKNGLQVWIEGQPDTSTLYPGSTTSERTNYKSPFKS